MIIDQPRALNSGGGRYFRVFFWGGGKPICGIHLIPLIQANLDQRDPFGSRGPLFLAQPLEGMKGPEALRMKNNYQMVP